MPISKDQYNFTDPKSRIMKTSKGFDQCYNAQIAVNDDMLIVSNYANVHHNDKQEFLPTIESVPDELKPKNHLFGCRYRLLFSAKHR